MQFIDLGKQYALIKDKVLKDINTILDNNHYIMGEQIGELEERLAKFCGRKYCLSCSSGTDALVIPLMAWNLQKNDAVFVPSFTFFASAESVNLAGGTPVFVDIDEDTFNMSISSLENAISKVIKEGKLNPRGIIPVDLFGQPAEYDKILDIAKKYNLFVLEDAAQGFGGNIRGVRAGKFGDVSATSFFPAKPLGCYGDGGAIFTDDDELYELMSSIRVHGHGSDKYDNVRIGINGRLDTIQSAILLSKMDLFEDELKKRQIIAEKYTSKLKDYYIVPTVKEGFFSSWAQFTLKAKDETHRDEIITKMKEQGIPIMVYYPIPLHEQTAYKSYGYSAEDLPVCSKVAKTVFSIPMYPYLSDEDLNLICENLIKLAK